MKKTIIMFAMLFMVAFGANAQKTIAELKAEREQLATELKDEKTIDRQQKLEKLANNAPSNVGLESVDGAATSATGLLSTIKSVNDILGKYRSEIQDNGNGEVEIQKYAANLNDYKDLLVKLTASGVLLKEGAEKLSKASEDVKTLSPLKAPKAVKSVKYSTDAITLSGEEIAFQTRIIKNLIESIQASNNM